MDANFGNLFGKDNTTKKLQQEIKGMELKKQSILSALQHEIEQLQHKVNETLLRIGSTVYTHHLDGSEMGDTLLSYYDEIASFKNTIQEKEEKRKDFATRYDEEISMLQMNVPQASAQPNPTVFSSAVSSFCESCGAPYISGEDTFCGSCGQKLP